MKAATGLFLLFSVSLALVLMGCSSSTPTPIPPTVTLTVVPTATPPPPTATATLPPPTLAPTATATRALPAGTTFQQASVASAGLSLDVPKGWTRVSGKWLWTMPKTTNVQVGLNWMDRKPGVEPITILPKGSVSTGASNYTVNWGTAAIHNVNIMQAGKRVSVQSHVVVLTTNRVYDIYGTAPTPAQLNTIEPIILHMADSVTLTQLTPYP